LQTRNETALFGKNERGYGYQTDGYPDGRPLLSGQNRYR
jgi:hypothetical protein